MTNISNNISIIKPKVVLVEGKNDKKFFEAFVKYLEIQNIQFISMDSKDNLNKIIKSLKNDFDKIKCLGIVRDADEDPNNSFKSICSILRNNGLPVPKAPLEFAKGDPSIIVLVIPPEDKGCLETLCFKAYSNNEPRECVEQYFECLRQKGLSPSISDESKAKLQVILASEYPELRIGEAAEKGLFCFDSYEFEPIRRFLISIEDFCEGK